MRNLLRLIVKHYFILLFLFLEGVGLILVFQFNPFQKSFITNVSRTLSGNLGSRINNIRDYIYLKEENISLSEENIRLKQQIEDQSKTVYLSLPNTAYSDTIAVDSGMVRFKFIPAEVVNNSVNKQYNYITLNKGHADSITSDMAVVSSEGVVGMVLSCSENFSTVLPLINRNSKTGAMIRGEDYFGILEWGGGSPELMHLKEIPIHVNIEIGDTIETSGYSSIYPKALAIGTISDFEKSDGNFYNISIKPFVNFRTINHVIVVSNELKEEVSNLEGGEAL